MIHDIKDARRALSSTSHCGLGPQAAMYLQVQPWKAEALESESDEKGFVDAARISRDKLSWYNGLDCVHTAQIRSHHLREFRNDENPARLKKLYSQQLRLAQAAARMSYNGFPIDDKRRRRLATQLTSIARAKSKEAATLISQHAKVKIHPPKQGDKWRGKAFRISRGGGINENDLRALLFEECSKPHIEGFNLQVPFSPEAWTDSGIPSVDKNALLLLFADETTPQAAKDIIRLCWQVDAPLKARSTFVDSQKLRDRIGPDGRLHADMNSCGAETGRWTCRSFNAFNLPEKKDLLDGALQGDLPNVRDYFVAPKGMVIVHRDWSQLELQVMYDVTEDALLGAMLSSADIHSARARAWFGIPENQPVPKMIRRQGKVVGFSSQYHAGLNTVFMKVLEQIQDARFEEVEALYNMFPKQHLGIAQHWKDSLRFANANGYNETRIMGRRRYYPPGVQIKDTETSNYEVQGGGADIANCTMVGETEEEAKSMLCARLDQEFPTAWLAMHTYDSFDVICNSKDAVRIDALLNECMSAPRAPGKRAARSFKSDGKVGQHWGEV